MSKTKRNKLLNDKKIRISTFFLINNQVISLNGITAHIRKNSDDFELLFVKREQELLSHLKLRDDEVFLDVGANVGYYTLRSSSNFPKNKVIAIEAHPDTFSALKKNVIEINKLKNVILINCAVYHSKKNLKIFEIGGESGRSSLYRPTDRFIEINGDTLDNILSDNQINEKLVVKMDIEGGEVDALKGAEKSLDNCRKIIVEIHDDNLQEVKNILKRKGFDIEVLNVPDGEFVIGTRD